MADKRSKLVLILFLVSAVVVLALSLYTGFSLNSLVDSLEQSRNERLLAEAQATSLVVSADELNVIQDTQSLASDQGAALQQRLSAFAALHNLTEITFIRQLPSGEYQYIISSDSGAGSYDISAAPFPSNSMIQQALSGSIVVVDLSQSQSEDSGLMAYSPVYDAAGNVVAVAAVGIDDSGIIQADMQIRNLTIILLVCIAIVILAACANVLLQVRKEHELQESVRLQKLMIKISQSLSSKLSFDESIQETLDTLGSYLGASRAYIINDPEHEGLHPFQHFWSEERTAADSAFSRNGDTPEGMSPGDAGTAASELIVNRNGDTPEGMSPGDAGTAGAELVNDKEASALWQAMQSKLTPPKEGELGIISWPSAGQSADIHAAALKDTHTAAYIWSPLIVQGELWGVLALDFSRPRKSFPENDLRFVASTTTDLVDAITRKLYNEQRDHALDHAIKASEAKSEFLSNMSHEMRTPMNAIIGMTSIALTSEDPARKDYCLEHIKDASAHLLTIINDVLDMSSLQSNELSLKLRPFSIREALDEVVRNNAHHIEDRHHVFSLAIDERIPAVLIGDRQRLSKVVDNLLSNAIKFTPDTGTIALRVKHLGAEEQGHVLRFEIEDNGIGVDPTLRDNLFGSFEQAESGATRKYGGTGLGLAISRRLVELMHGQMALESKVHEGSLFTFTVVLEEDTSAVSDQLTLDVEEANDGRSTTGQLRQILDIPESDEGRQQKAHAKDRENSWAIESSVSKETPDTSEAHDLSESGTPNLSRYRILLAEDIEINREVVLALLGDTGIQVDTTTNGKEAFEAIKTNPGSYDLVFMDLQMPEMDGLDATRRIRALPNPEVARLPIIAMTANVFQEDIEACLEAGMDDHIGKPISLEAIYRILLKHLPSRE